MQKDDFNQKQYDEHFETYVASNPEGLIGGGTPSERIDLIQKYLPKGSRILEIGSGEGKDALLLQEAGYEVIASDFVQGFVNILKNKGLKAISFNAKQDNLPNDMDAIYANAVFVHFSPEEISQFLAKAKSALKAEKLIFMSFIKGAGHERSARQRGIERDFWYYTLETMSSLLKKEGYLITYSNDDDPKWIQMIAKVENYD